MAGNRRNVTPKSRRKHRWKGFQRTTGVGALPGTISASISSQQCQIHRLTYSRHEVIDETLLSVAQLTAPAAEGVVTWIQVNGNPDVTLLNQLAATFGIHSLALEDISNTHQRCKVENYGSHLFVVTRLPRYLDGQNLVTEQVSMLIGVNYLVSIHDGQDIFGAVRDRIIRSQTRLHEMPSDYLGYTILDMVTDHYFPVIEAIGSRLNAVDDTLETQVSQSQRSEIRDLRADLLLLRRTIWPQRDAISSLLRGDADLISDATKTYLRDCYDHTIQIIDITETYRELCADLRDYHLSEISFRSNEVMKTLTIIATLFMPLSFVAGFYGMNFEHMPELHWKYSYPLVIAFMTLIAGTFFWWFWRRGWLK